MHILTAWEALTKEFDKRAEVSTYVLLLCKWETKIFAISLLFWFFSNERAFDEKKILAIRKIMNVLSYKINMR